jgi:hypothetical protein
MSEETGREGAERHGAEQRLRRLLALIIEVAADAVGFDGATVTVRQGDHLATVAATRLDLMLLDAAQYADDEGPCLEAIAQGMSVEWTPADEDDRWRSFQEAAASLGISTSLSFPLPIDEPAEIAASLNLYASRRQQLSSEQLELATQCALQLGIVLQMITATRATADVTRRAAEAMRSRALIEQAKGVLAAQRRVSVSDASALLIEVANAENATLRDVAARIVDGGTTGGRAS